jgi:hypothetical protein
MPTNATQAEKPTDDANWYSRHKEPAHIGGATYVRCRDCGAESVMGPSSVLHYGDCSHTPRVEVTR